LYLKLGLLLLHIIYEKKNLNIDGGENPGLEMGTKM
jgi:hypothetical protein